MTPTQIDLRMLIVQSLELLASKDAAFEYQRTVPMANVPAELFCWWFDDAYHPSSEVFQGAFTEAELQVLAAFHSVFKAASIEIQEPLPSLEQLLDLPAWQPVAKGARVALINLSVVLPNQAFKPTLLKSQQRGLT